MEKEGIMTHTDSVINTCKRRDTGPEPRDQHVEGGSSEALRPAYAREEGQKYDEGREAGARQDHP